MATQTQNVSKIRPFNKFLRELTDNELEGQLGLLEIELEKANPSVRSSYVDLLVERITLARQAVSAAWREKYL